MSGAPPPAVSPSPRPRARARARGSLAVALTAPALLGALIGDLVLAAVRRDLALLFTGALLVLVAAALSVALQARSGREAAAPTARGGDHGAP